MIETDRLEFEMQTGTTYWDCFNKVNRRRTEISIGVFATQVFSGIYLVGYAAYFFTRKFRRGRAIVVLMPRSCWSVH
jgi:SP family general alpha glucoside:H+ symporter-like MFS transporter